MISYRVEYVAELSPLHAVSEDGTPPLGEFGEPSLVLLFNGEQFLSGQAYWLEDTQSWYDLEVGELRGGTHWMYPPKLVQVYPSE